MSCRCVGVGHPLADSLLLNLIRQEFMSRRSLQAARPELLDAECAQRGVAEQAEVVNVQTRRWSHLPEVSCSPKEDTHFRDQAVANWDYRTVIGHY